MQTFYGYVRVSTAKQRCNEKHRIGENQASQVCWFQNKLSIGGAANSAAGTPMAIPTQTTTRLRRSTIQNDIASSRS
jgi:hypothetical protein